MESGTLLSEGSLESVVALAVGSAVFPVDADALVSLYPVMIRRNRPGSSSDRALSQAFASMEFLKDKNYLQCQRSSMRTTNQRQAHRHWRASLLILRLAVQNQFGEADV